MRNIPTEQEAERILSPYYGQITDSIKRGFADYADIIGYDCYSKSRILPVDAKTRAGFINMLIRNRISESFKKMSGVTAKDYNGIFGLHFRNQLLLRFKKFNARLAPSRSATRQTRKIDNQQTVIPGFPRKPTFLYVGYTFKSGMSGIENIYLSLRVKGKREWIMDISGKALEVQNVIPFTSIKESAKRVNVRQGVKQARKTS
jgi:hypothetical protein